MKIVRIEPEHFQQCEQIEFSAFGGGRNDDFEKCSKDKNYIVLVACEDKDVLGYVIGLNIADTVEIISIAVDGAKRRVGIGGELVRSLLRESMGRGAVEAFLEVGEKNLGARALYEKTGFVAISVRQKYYNNSEDAIIMKMQLV